MTMLRDDAETASRTLQPAPETGHPPDTPGARAQIRDVKEQVVDQAKISFRQARDSAASSLNDSRHRAAEGIGAIASAVRDTDNRLRAGTHRVTACT